MFLTPANVIATSAKPIYLKFRPVPDKHVGKTVFPISTYSPNSPANKNIPQNVANIGKEIR